jgi:hypothetical protein
VIDIAGVKRLVDEKQIPVAMIIAKKEKSSAQFGCTLSEAVDLNAKGWKLAHVKPVGLNARIPLSEIPIALIKDHFARLMSPSNMFVVPKRLAGLAEVPEFIRVMEKYTEGSR